MQLVEQHVIHKGDSRYVTIDQAAFASKNLYVFRPSLLAQIQGQKAWTQYPDL